MRKTAAILLIGIFLFNWIGYRVLTSLLQVSANTKFELQLDNNNYDESDLISLKVAANLPYYPNSKSYERIAGEIEIEGVHYNYVKRRLYNDSLEYLCIPNRVKIRLSNARDEFFKLVNDIQQTSQKKPGNSISIKSLLTEYYQGENAWTFKAYSPDQKINFPYYATTLRTAAHAPEEMPPDVC